MLRTLGVVASLCASACASNVELVKTRAGRDFSCPLREIALVEQREDISEPTYEIEACGHRARYSCHERRRGVNGQPGGCMLDIEYPRR